MKQVEERYKEPEIAKFTPQEVREYEARRLIGISRTLLIQRKIRVRKKALPRVLKLVRKRAEKKEGKKEELKLTLKLLSVCWLWDFLPNK